MNKWMKEWKLKKTQNSSMYKVHMDLILKH